MSLPEFQAVLPTDADTVRATWLVLDRTIMDIRASSQCIYDLNDPSVDEDTRHRAMRALDLFDYCSYTLSDNLVKRLGDASEIRRRHEYGVLEAAATSISAAGDLEGMESLDDSDAAVAHLTRLSDFLRANLNRMHLTEDERRLVSDFQRRYGRLQAQRSRLTEMTAREEVSPRPRVNEETPEETARRRRRREAMVLNEGDRPLSQRDIIQRRRTEDSTSRPLHSAPRSGGEEPVNRLAWLRAPFDWLRSLG